MRQTHSGTPSEFERKASLSRQHRISLKDQVNLIIIGPHAQGRIQRAIDGNHIKSLWK